MSPDAVRAALDQALTGRFAHPDPAGALVGLDTETAGRLPDGAPRTIHEILAHLVYWQDSSLRWLEGVEPPDVEPEESWPAAPHPAGPEAWADLVLRFNAGVEAACRAAREGDLDAPLPGIPGAVALACLQTLATHNSFHLGQVVLIRRLLGVWPPKA